MTRWIKLEVMNDWGTEAYTMPGERLDRNGTNRSGVCLKFTDGRLLHVRWPDGSTSLAEVKHRAEAAETFDMGHRSSHVYAKAGVEFVFRGIKGWVPLNELEVDEADVKDLPRHR